MDNWPTYYPASMSKEEVATEMLAHRFAIGPGNHVQSSPHIDVYHRYAGELAYYLDHYHAYGANMTAIWQVIFA